MTAKAGFTVGTGARGFSSSALIAASSVTETIRKTAAWVPMKINEPSRSFTCGCAAVPSTTVPLVLSRSKGHQALVRRRHLAVDVPDYRQHRRLPVLRPPALVRHKRDAVFRRDHRKANRFAPLGSASGFVTATEYNPFMSPTP